MKQFYLFFIALIITHGLSSQSYQFGFVQTAAYDFKVVAIPDFNSSGNTDVSDIGFTVVLPSGVANIINVSSLIPNRTWSVQLYDAAFLSGMGLGDGTKDVFLFNLPPGQTILSHTSGQQIDLVSFSLSNLPTAGEMTFLLNSDPIAMGASGVLDSFYNSNIDGTTTQDYFGGLAAGMDAIMFGTLGIQSNILDDVLVYPNPTNNWINIKGSLLQNFNITIYSARGQFIQQFKESYRLDVSHLESGIYYVKIVTATLSKTFKIIKI